MSSSTPTQGDQFDGSSSIKDSIAALRSILMIDTPTKSLLSPSVAAQQSRAHQWDELSKLRNKTNELKHQVQEAANEAAQETRKRKTLQTTYEALAKYKKELSVQLELVSKSREAAEEKLASLRKTLTEERAAMTKERAQWKPELDRLTREATTLKEQSKALEASCVITEQKLQQCETRVTIMEKKCEEAQAKMQTLQSSQSVLQPRVEQSEKARQKAEETLMEAQKELDTIKRRHQKSLASMLQIQQNLKNQLKDVQDEKKSLEESLLKVQKDLEKANANATNDTSTSTNKQERKVHGVDAPKQINDGPLLQHEISNSITALDKFIQNISVSDNVEIDKHMSLTLKEIADGIKAEMSQLRLAKTETETKLSSTVAVDKSMEYDLAINREQLREVRDQLLASREEVEQLRAELTLVRSGIAGNKRSIEDRSKPDANIDDVEEYQDYDTKRRKGDEKFGVFDV